MKFIIPIIISVLVVSYLVKEAINESSNKVVTVKELVSSNQKRSKIRLGGRLTEDEIKISTNPRREVKFNINDISNNLNSNDSIKVVYLGIMPDTLKPGRDVILEGSYEPESGFLATQLNTQCPSKYEPPDPTKNSNPNNTKSY